MSDGITSPMRRVRERRGLPEEPGHEVHLEHPEAERRPCLAREQRDDLVLAALEHVGGLEEDPLAHRGRRLRPGRRGGRGGLDRAPGIRAGAGRDLGDELAVERVAILERATVLGVGPLTADEEPLRGDLSGVRAHCFSLCWIRAVQHRCPLPGAAPATGDGGVRSGATCARGDLCAQCSIP